MSGLSNNFDGSTGSGGDASAANQVLQIAEETSIKTAVQIMDDWDETDRAKVNIIAGQAGITAGAGSVAANTPRITHASDDPTVTALQLIDNAVSGNGFNTTQLGGVDVSMNSGVRDAGTQRVTIATNDAVPVTDNSSSLSVDWNGTQPVTGSGNATAALRVELPTNGTGVLATVGTVTTVATVTNITNQGHLADDSAFTPATTRVMMNGYFADETATDSVDEGDGGAARMTLDRKQIVSNYVHAAGGATPYVLISGASTNATSVKGSAATLYGIQVYNINAAVRYLKLYNKATAPTVGTDTPVKVIAIPGATTGAGSNVSLSVAGDAFGTGLAFALTTGIAHTDTAAVAANEIIVNLDYA